MMNIPLGIKMIIDCGHTSRALAIRGVHEEFQTHLFSKALTKNDIVVDIGAHIGYYSLMSARIVGNGGKVYAFEPDPENLRLLLKNIRLNGFSHIIYPVRKAISDVSGVTKLFLSSEDTGSHSISVSNRGKQHVEVRTITLDEFFATLGNYEVDIIKMDIEGAEMKALLGMDKVLRNNNDLVIFSEFWPYGIAHSGHSPRRFLKIIKEYGFLIYIIDDEQGRIRRADNVDYIMDFLKREKSRRERKMTNLLFVKGKKQEELS